METRRLWMMWWSGALGLAAFAHMLRALAGVTLSVGTVSIPVWVSWVVFPAAGIASMWLMRRSLEALPIEVVPLPRAQRGQLPVQPPVVPTPERDGGEGYCGASVGYHFVSEDDEAEE